MLMNMDNGYEQLAKDLVEVQNKFLATSLPPEKGEKWVIRQIEGRWKSLLSSFPQDDHKTRMVWQTIGKLKKALHFGQDHDIISNYNKIPEELKREWVNLIYSNTDSFDASFLERLIKILGNSSLDIPSRERSKKTLTQLKVLAETMNHLERNTNFLLRQVLNGNSASLPGS